METRVKFQEDERSDAVADYLDERLAHIEKLLGSDSELARCEVEIIRDAGRPRHGANIWSCEVQIFRPGRESLRATNHSESVNGAIDDAKDEIVRQIKEEKEKRGRSEREQGTRAKDLMREDDAE